VRTQRSNVLSIPSDCPTREKRGWMVRRRIRSRVERAHGYTSGLLPGGDMRTD
jgi:hypothetical protein